MNHYTELLYYLKELLENDALINTVTQGEDDKVSLNKMDLFPLAHIEVGDAILTNGQTIGFNCRLTCLDIVDINNEINTEKFFTNSNEVDIYNEMFAVINRFWTTLNQDFERKGFDTPENGTAEKGSPENKDFALGWTLPFVVSLPNRELKLIKI